MWRSWLAHLVWDQRVLCSSHSTPTKEIKVFDFGLFFYVCSPPSGGRFWSRVPSKEQGKGSPERTKRAGPFRALKMRPVRQVLLLARHASENASRTPGACFEHRTHIPYHRRPSPVPNARHRGKLPPQRSLAYILVDLFFVDISIPWYN